MQAKLRIMIFQSLTFNQVVKNIFINLIFLKSFSWRRNLASNIGRFQNYNGHHGTFFWVKNLAFQKVIIQISGGTFS